MKNGIFTIILSLFFLNLFGQEFSASFSTNKILENTTVDITFTLVGVRGSGFAKPDFGKLQVVGGPKNFQKSSFVNGSSTYTQAVTYSLLANKAGKYKVGSAAIKVKGKTLRTKPITLTVVKGKAVKKGAKKDKKVYVEMVASDTMALLGQQITLEYILYTQEDINGYDLVNESEYEGFFSQELRNYRANVVRVIVKGEQYYTKTIKKVALFPQRTGKFDFDPVLVTLAIPLPGQRQTIWNNGRTRKIQVSTNPLSIIVSETPPNAPISFSGAVGKYRMASTINKKRLTTDDAFVVVMEVRGTGDGKTFSAAKQPHLDEFEYYDPNIIRDEDTSKDGIISNYKKIEYLFAPKKPGRYIIKPEFTYYDSDSNDYITLSPNAFRVSVSQGTRKVTVDDRNVSVSQSQKADRDSVSMLSNFWLKYLDGLLYAVFGLSFLALLLMGYKKSLLVKQDQLDPEEKRRLKAKNMATSKLELAKSHQSDGNGRKFYEEISTAMNGYLGDKFGLANSDFKKELIVESLKRGNVNELQINTYLEILKACEMALFAGQPLSHMEEIYQRAKMLILEIEDNG
ncbi:MAG: BatD family protein [Saprospiraceae bacterium]